MNHHSDVFTGPFEYRSAEIGQDGNVNLFRIVDILQESAGKHADRLGFGMDALADMGATWALTRLQIKMHCAVVGGENYTVETWPSGTHRLWAIRRYRLTQTHGVRREMGQAVSHWMILDKNTHRPLRLPDSITNRSWPTGLYDEPEWARYPSMEEMPQTSRSEEFKVRLHEIDINDHVNNAHYLAWAMNEAAELTQTKWVAAEADIYFEAESKFGDRIHLLSGYDLGTDGASDDVAGYSGHHIIRSDDSTRVARVFLRWEKA